MVFSVNKVWLLLLGLGILFAYGYYWAKLNRRLKGLRKGVFTTLRLVIVFSLILSLAGLQGTVPSKRQAVFFLADGSQSSLDNRTQYGELIGNAMDKIGAKDKAGVLVFGEKPVAKVFLSKTPNYSKLSFSGINEGFTNIEKAVENAVKLLPKGYSGKVVILTDGEENIGSIEKTARLLKERNIEVLSYKLKREIKNETAVDKLDIPKSVEKGKKFDITVQISSTVNQDAVLSLDGPGGRQEKKVHLTKGTNRFVFSDTAGDSGLRVYNAFLSASIDTETKNNQLSTFTEIKSKPAMLVISNNKDDSRDIEGVLKANNADYYVKTAKEAPGKMEDLLKYKAVIMCNVSAENLPEGFMDNIEAYVKDFGRGLIATGGEDSFALGGYFKTSLEKTLPVYMEMKGKKQIPDMALALIIDKSGSMQEGRGGIMKVDLAKEAAARVLDSLRPNDSLGIIAFDENVFWVQKTAKVTDPESFRDAIGTIRAGGGTSIQPALQAGITSLKNTKAKIKHIILLTDGQAESTGYDTMLEDAKKEGITISTVAVGLDADRRLLFNIAEKCDGRFYVTNELSNIPAIFAKETFMATKEYLNNRTFTPKITGNHKVIENIGAEGLPNLRGYIGSSMKPSAIQLLASDKDDPILAVWNYGSGRAAAWASDVSGKWNGEWIGWGENRLMWSNILSWAAGSSQNQDLVSEMDIQGGKGVLRLYDKKYGKNSGTEGTGFVINPDGTKIEVPMMMAEPGVYEGQFNAEGQGVYTGAASVVRDGIQKNGLATGAVNRYSAEFSLLANSDRYDNFIKEVGGTSIDSPNQVFKSPKKAVKSKIDFTEILLWLAAILFLLDVAVRRLPIPFEEWELVLRKKYNDAKEKSKVSKRKKGEKRTGISSNIVEQRQLEKLGKLENEKIKNEKEDKKFRTPKSGISEKSGKIEEEQLDISQLLKNKKDRKH